MAAVNSAGTGGYSSTAHRHDRQGLTRRRLRYGCGSDSTGEPPRVASQEPASTSGKPITIPSVSGSPRISTPSSSGHGRIDVGDDLGSRRAHLADQGEQEHECDGRAQHPQHGHRCPCGAGDRRGRARCPGERRVDDGVERQRGGDHRQAGDLVQPLLDDDRPQRVAEHGDADGGDGEPRAAGHVEPDEGADPQESDGQSHATAGRPVGVQAEGPREDRADDRNGGDEQGCRASWRSAPPPTSGRGT